MIHVFLIELGNGPKTEKSQEHQNAERYLSAHPMFQELEEAIGAMEHHIAETSFKHKILLQLRRNILESFGLKEKNEPEPERKSSERKKEAPEMKTPPLETANPRLAILEEGIKKVIKIFKKAPTLKRFKSLKRPLEVFIAAMEKFCRKQKSISAAGNPAVRRNITGKGIATGTIRR